GPQTRGAGSCPAAGRLGVTRVFRHATASPGERADGRRYTGIHPGVAVAGKHSLAEVRRAVEQALPVGAVTRDAVAQFLWPQESWRATVFRLDGHPHLRHVQVATADLNEYRSLLCAGGVR